MNHNLSHSYQLLLAATLLITAHAAGATSPAPSDAAMTLCATESEAARRVMQLRQRGAPLSRLMETTNGTSGTEVQRRQRDMILEAYSQPRFHTDEAIERAITDFENDEYLRCARRLSLGDQ